MRPGLHTATCVSSSVVCLVSDCLARSVAWGAWLAGGWVAVGLAGWFDWLGWLAGWCWLAGWLVLLVMVGWLAGCWSMVLVGWLAGLW